MEYHNANNKEMDVQTIMEEQIDKISRNHQKRGNIVIHL